MTSYLVEDDDIGRAWARALARTMSSSLYEAVPLTVAIQASSGQIRDDPKIRGLVDTFLEAKQLASVRTVANTIFPISMWSPGVVRHDLYRRYRNIWPRVRQYQHRGETYFYRMIAFGAHDGDDGVNQLEHIISTRARGNFRRSALQIGFFDPTRDHTHSRQQGFPCLQQICVTPKGKERLTLIAFYATQSLTEKAYGNYLGLAALGRFIAHELGRELSSITCVAGVAKAHNSPCVRVGEIRKLCQEIQEIIS